MPKRNLHIIPSAVALLAPTTFIFTYALSVYLDDVTPLFPYVSTTGTVEPESYVFSFLLNITAFLLGTCVYVRHLFVRKFAKFRQPRGFFLNRVATSIGFISCFGLDLVANFQVTKCAPVHYVGAGLCFFGGTIYFYMQTVLSQHTEEDLEIRSLYSLRLFLVFLSMGFLVVALVTGFMSKKRFHGTLQRKWRIEDGGYFLHIASTTSEWLLVLIQGSLVLTFLPAFKCVAIMEPRVVVDLKEEPRCNDDFTKFREYTDEDNVLKVPLMGDSEEAESSYDSNEEPIC